MMQFLYMLLIAILLLISTVTRAQTDTIRPGKGGLVTRTLRPGVRQYLLVYLDPEHNVRQLRFWYWVREIASGQRNGQSVFFITQRWYGSDTGVYREVYSVNDARDFSPVYHRELVHGKLNAYDWGKEGIRGADTVPDNARKGFSLAFTEPNLNWNLDIETFEMLPLAEGRSFLINFYDAGLDPPQYQRYTVKGSEKVTLQDGVQMDCWILSTEGKSPTGTEYTETYWISKKEHAFLKEEDHFNGMIRYKLLMPISTPDIRAGLQ
ncbi:DUF3108 domain-containing protein [Puia dinghuensis]|uniref:DUF3108 domain-containing protein n=1 Tax=Puia dinghuensis TaxID=1792502 RepID=A0A8J2XS27_9BACT|nr:hypothetical protein [Puia dinghuensis]GGA89196.1 hypothetical protein GCM10011511_10540 [Puia dinghuensis]